VQAFNYQPPFAYVDPEDYRTDCASEVSEEENMIENSEYMGFDEDMDEFKQWI